MKNVNSLLKLFLKLDYRDRDSKTFKKVIGVLVSYLIAGVGLSYNYFMNYDYISCIVLIFSFNSFLILFLILSDYPNLFFSKNNIDVLNSYPIKFSEFILAKIISATIYILFFAIILAIPQTIFYILIYKKIFIYNILFFFQNISFVLFFIFIILIIYSYIVKIFVEKSSFIIYIVQLSFIMLILLSTSFTSKNESQETLSILKYEFIKYSPQYIYAIAFDEIIYFILTSLTTFSVVLIFYIFLIKNFNDILYKLTLSKQERKISRYKVFIPLNKIDYIAEKFFLKTKDEKAGFFIAKEIISGSKSMLLKYIPLFLMPIIVALIGIITDDNSFLLIRNKISDVGILNPSITLLVLMMFRITINNLKFADENSENVEWIFQSLPFSHPKLIINGCLKYISLYFFFPIFILLTLLLMIKVNPEAVIANNFFIFSIAFFISKLSIIRVKTFPFTIEITKINSFARLSELFISIFLGIITFVLQILVFRNYIFILISIIFILLLNTLANFIIFKYDARARKSGLRITSN